MEPGAPVVVPVELPEGLGLPVGVVVLVFGLPVGVVVLVLPGLPVLPGVGGFGPLGPSGSVSPPDSEPGTTVFD